MRERDRGRTEEKNFVGDVQTKEKKTGGTIRWAEKRQLSKRKEDEVDGQGQKDLG